MTRIAVRSPAKINLGLDVLGRRADGYHEVRTLLQLVDLMDTVEIEPTADGVRLTSTGWPVPGGDENLAARAAALLLEEVGASAGVVIRLEKRIPVAAGLGGGSSNAAAVLWGTNALLGLGLPLERLRALAARLGSDVPFFLNGGTALARGRGEILEAASLPRPLWVIIARAGPGVAAAWAYGQIRPEALTGEDRATTIARLMAEGETDRALNLVRNDLEPGVLAHHAEAAALKARLAAAGASPVLLCGSGSAVMGIVAERARGRGIVAELVREGIFATLCQTLDRNPILEAGPEAEAGSPVPPEKNPWPS